MKHFLLTTALSLIVAAPLLAAAPEVEGPPTDAEIANEAFVPPVTPMEIILQSRQDFLFSLYDAQIALHNKNAEKAAEHIDAALRLVDELQDVDKETDFGTDKALYNTLRRVVELDFGTFFTPERAVMPVTNENLTGAKLYEAINIEELEEGTLKEAKIRYIAFDIDSTQFKGELTEALKAIKEDDLYSAQYDLLQIQRDMLEDVDMEIPPTLQARDNIALARFLLAHREYGAAVKALDSVEAALSDLNGSNQPQLVERAKEEVAALREYASKRDTERNKLMNKSFSAPWS